MKEVDITEIDKFITKVKCLKVAEEKKKKLLLRFTEDDKQKISHSMKIRSGEIETDRIY